MGKPFTFNLTLPKVIPDHCDNHIIRKLSSLKGQVSDSQALASMLAQEDCLVYDVYEFQSPEKAGEMNMGISIVHPGKIGQEYFMTKGHFHTILETAEVYSCLKGQGVMVMETLEGEWAVEELLPGRILYVPPCWAHRSVNTGSEEDLITFFVYPANAGHDYGTIEEQGFSKLILEIDGHPKVVDNPRWRPPGGGSNWT